MAQGFELFSDFFALRDNALSRLDARVKLFGALAACVTVILSTKVALPLGVLVLSLSAMTLVKVPARIIIVRFLPPLALVLVLGVMRPFFIGSTPWWTFSVGPWTLTATHEGVADSLRLASRVLGATSALILFSLVTPVHQLFAALSWLRMPRAWVETAMLMYRYIFCLLDQASDVYAAQRVRLGYAGARRSLASMGVLAGALLSRSLDQADHTHEAMVARGYTGRLPIGHLPALRISDGLAATCMAAFFAVAYWAVEKCL